MANSAFRQEEKVKLQEASFNRSYSNSRTIIHSGINVNIFAADSGKFLPSQKLAFKANNPDTTTTKSQTNYYNSKKLISTELAPKYNSSISNCYPIELDNDNLLTHASFMKEAIPITNQFSSLPLPEEEFSIFSILFNTNKVVLYYE